MSEDLENDILQTESNDGISTYDFYDNYYNQVLQNLDSIEENQQTIIYNQEQIQLDFNNKIDRLQQGTDMLVFLLGVFFIYTLIRNMLKR